MTATMIYKKFKSTVTRLRLIEPGDKVLVAFSGGQDSMALLELLLELRREMPIGVVVAHFNHNLRPGAGDDEVFAKAAARKRRLPVVTGSRNVRLFAKRQRLNMEEAARELRYAFLWKAALRVGATKIATGHTLTDQAETVLMRIVRGTGLLGLGGIAPGPEGPLIRPLLGVERAETEAYLSRRGIPFRTDETNLDRRILRNRIRLETLPAFARVDPSVARHLGRLAALARDEEELLGKVTATAWQELARREGGVFSLDASALSDLPRALARRVVRRFLSGLPGGLRGVSFEEIEDILALKEGKEKTLGKRRVVRREAGRVFLKRPGARATKEPFEALWDGKGTIKLPGAFGRFRGLTIDRNWDPTIERKKGDPQAYDNRKRAFSKDILPALDDKKRALLRDKLPAYDDKKRALLDAASFKFPLTVRSRRPGDKYRPLGAPGTKKLKEILRAKEIPLAERDTLPVFLSGDKIVWVPGLPVAEQYKLKPRTQTVFLVQKL
jgi:tRNA(Ile)-lysidine synthase